MQVVVSSKKRIGRIAVTTNTDVGRVTFGKIAKVGSIGLEDIGNVITAGQQDGDVLVYQSNTSTYNIKTLPKVDGGLF